MNLMILDPTNEAVPVERQISERPKTYMKPTFSKPAPDALRAEILENNNFVVEGLAD